MSYIRLITGKKYYFTELNLNNDVFVEDLVPALVNVNRFSGHSQWDVLRHSHVVADYCTFATRTKSDKDLTPTLSGDPLFEVHGLVHDLVEAVMGDVATPLKALLPDYQNLYRIHENYWMKRLGLPELNQIQIESLHLADKIVGDVEGKVFIQNWEPIYDSQFAKTDKYRFYMASKGHIKERIKYWAGKTNAHCIESFYQRLVSYR